MVNINEKLNKLKMEFNSRKIKIYDNWFGKCRKLFT